VRRVEVDLLKALDVPKVREFAGELVRGFTAEEYDAVYMIYNEFKSILQQRPVVERLLPIPLEVFARTHPESALEAEAKARAVPGAGGQAGASKMAPEDYIYEPDDQSLFDRLLPRHVGTQVYRALLESGAAEQGARMTAMNNATRNASDMIDSLTLQMNKIRQAAITKEILEVVGGAEALK
jgi:F-type H+-transporting ATPase subunit gamma